MEVNEDKSLSSSEDLDNDKEQRQNERFDTVNTIQSA